MAQYDPTAELRRVQEFRRGDNPAKTVITVLLDFSSHCMNTVFVVSLQLLLPDASSSVTASDSVWVSFVDDGRSDETDERDRRPPVATGATLSDQAESDQSSRINPDEPFDYLSN